MKFFACLLGLSFIANSLAAESDVLDLGDSDFATRVTETETTLVMFCKYRNNFNEFFIDCEVWSLNFVNFDDVGIM